MEIFFVRHGEPQWAVDAVTQTDPHLTERGHAQATITAARLAALDPPLTEILVSPATRSQETAVPLAASTALEPVTVAGLAEIRMPRWEGRLEDEVQRVYRAARHRSPDEWWDGLPGGESFRNFHERVTSTLATELRHRGVRPDDYGRTHLWHVEKPDQRIAVVAHGGTNSVSLGWLLDLEPTPWEWERFVLGHCSLARL
ncbi:MAG: histidine phosphatase family protein, partial [Acidimicrobiia bacterium]|nr:histidine phosphatase family protein [Acidimicrobiia bacterium]